MNLPQAKLLHLFAVLAVGLLVGACNSVEKMQENAEEVKLEAEPEILRVRGDSIRFTINATIPPKYFAKKAMLIVQPKIVYGEKEKTFENYILAGEDAYTGDLTPDQIVKPDQSTSFSIERQFPYDEEMREVTMSMKGVFQFLSPEADKFDAREELNAEATTERELAEGTIITALRVKPTDNLQYEVVQEPQPESRNAKIFYEINRSVVRESQIERQEVQSLSDFADREGFVFRGLTITSAASPDGEYRLNKNLAAERSQAAMNWVNKDLRDMGIRSVNDSDFFRRSNIDENFDGLKEEIRKSNLPDKQRILKILNSGASNEEKEARLRKVPSAEYILEEIMPRLRYSKITYRGYTRQRPLSKVRQVYEKKGDTALSYDELSRLASSMEGNTQKEKELFESMVERYPRRVGGYVNLGHWFIEDGQYAEAISILKRGEQKFPGHPMISNNLGVAQRHLKQYEKAQQNLLEASRKDIDQANNFGILYINTGEYGKATDNFDNVECGNYNAALAYTLNEQYQKAKDQLDCITDKDGMDFYLRAIIGARSDDKELMTTSLRRAVQQDGKFREMARNDLEFRDYKDDPAFQSALR
jgi:tetratricopeptide (TPR) repeat protein